jgi:hypothetical protein
MAPNYCDNDTSCYRAMTSAVSIVMHERSLQQLVLNLPAAAAHIRHLAELCKSEVEYVSERDENFFTLISHW